MRKVIVLEFITLDGVIQAGGGPEEDTSGGFAYGGWEVPYGDDVVGAAITKQMNMPFDLLLGPVLSATSSIEPGLPWHEVNRRTPQGIPQRTAPLRE
jgi:hypothetical protein